MKREVVRVENMRIRDARVGDVVNRYRESETGWFEVASVDTLFNGDLQLTDSTAQITISGGDFDLVGYQVVQYAGGGVVEQPETIEIESEESIPDAFRVEAEPAIEPEPDVPNIDVETLVPDTSPDPVDEVVEAEPKQKMFIAKAKVQEAPEPAVHPETGVAMFTPKNKSAPADAPDNG